MKIKNSWFAINISLFEQFSAQQCRTWNEKMNVEKYVIPEVCSDDDWNYLLGRTLEKDRIWDPSNKFSSGVTPIKGHQLLV